MAAAGGHPETLRLSVLATHPIQYHAPWFRALAAHRQMDLQVLYEYLPDDRAQGAGFGRAFQWDVPLLDGYAWQVLAPGQRPGARSRTAALAGLRAHLAARAPQVLLLTGWHSWVLLAAPLLARRAGVACLVRGESNDLKPRPRWVRRAHRALLSRYDGFLCIGSANRDFYRGHGIAASRLFDCPYFVDNARFAAQARTVGREQQRRRFGIPADAVCFVFAGKLEAKKRPLDAIAALRAVAPAPVHLLVVGSGALEAQARTAAAGAAVSFAGFLNQGEMAAAYAAGDCLVLPSDHGETWGLVVNEAMACGLPAIVSDQVGCGRDLVTAGETGWVYPAGQVPALAHCMAEAAADPARLQRMGRAARERVTARHGVQGAVDAVVAASRAVAARAHRAA